MKLKTIDYLRETKQEFYLCRICHDIVKKEHSETQEHIDMFHTVVGIEVKKSFKNSFLSIKTQFTTTTYKKLTTIFTEILKASHNNQTSIFAFTFKFKLLLIMLYIRIHISKNI